MKKSSPFSLQKVKKYSRAKYASESPKSLIRHALWLAWNFPNKIIKGAVTALLIAGLAVGLQACNDDVTIDGDSKFHESCMQGEAYCIDIVTVAKCGENEHFYQEDCNEFCLENNGNEYHSVGCFNDKCQCNEYVIDGGIPFECYPGEVYCEESNILRICYDETWTWESCEDICKAQGDKMISKGCDAYNNENPCLCEEGCTSCGDNDDDLDATELDKTESDGDLDAIEEDKIETDGDLIDIEPDNEYDNVEGASAECLNDESYCLNNETMIWCNEYNFWESEDCYDFCLERYGSDYRSYGCYQDKCQCEYGETEGVDANCSHGQEYCITNETVAQCDDGGYYVDKSCDDVCVENHGEGFSSAGCDDSADEKCQCEQTPADGDLDAVDLDRIESDEISRDGDYDSVEGEYVSDAWIKK